jgi:hypothetical protein
VTRIKSYLLLASWILAFTSVWVMPFLWDPDSQELFPVANLQKFESNLDPNSFTFEGHFPPSFTVYELVKLTMTVVAAGLWFVALALMIKDRDRVIVSVIERMKEGRTIA